MPKLSYRTIGIISPKTATIMQYTPLEIVELIAKDLTARGFSCEPQSLRFQTDLEIVSAKWGMPSYTDTVFKGAEVRVLVTEREGNVQP